MKLAAALSQDFQAAVRNLANEKLPMATARKINKIVKQINTELDQYNELLKKLQNDSKNEAGEVDQEAFMKGYQELVNLEIEHDKIESKEIEHISISTKDLSFLESILSDSEA